jgi:hypothetical protein
MGFKGASLCQTKKKVIESFLHLLESMIIELNCYVTPLPDLCRIASGASGVFRKIMGAYSESLEIQIAPDPVACMEYTIAAGIIPCQEFSCCLRDLSGALGCYDLSGQVKQLEGLHSKWSKILEQMERELSVRVRYFRVFGICLGCALAILLV